MGEKIAHVKKNEDGSWAEPQRLDDHLEGTAKRAEEFAQVFFSGAWGRACGIGHDMGKARETWQDYLCTKSGYDEEAHLEMKNGKMDHSTPSAKLAEEIFGKGIGRILSYCFAGHHAGLPDWMGAQSALAFRLENARTEDIPIDVKKRMSPDVPLSINERIGIMFCISCYEFTPEHIGFIALFNYHAFLSYIPVRCLCCAFN